MLLLCEPFKGLSEINLRALELDSTSQRVTCLHAILRQALSLTFI